MSPLEVIPHPFLQDGGRKGAEPFAVLDPRVQDAFMQGLQPFVIWRNKVERYEIRVVEITAAIPQTFGSHYAFDTDILGRSLHPNVPMWNWFDVGFYDSHNVTVRRIGKQIRIDSYFRSKDNPFLLLLLLLQKKV